MSFEQILTVSDRNGIPFDRIVLENSGVAEPQNIRDAFTEAQEMGHPVLSRIHLSTLVCISIYPSQSIYINV
jgi:G3E family GTPase